MIHRPFSTAMIDMLLCTVIALFIAIAPPKAADGVTSVADYQLTMRWERGVNIDMDVYVMAPDKTVVWYSDKHEGHMNIDRDDLGLTNDTDDNVETVFLRAPIDGDYYVTVHTYNLDGLAPIGMVTVAVQDKHGVQPFPPIAVPMPPEKEEVGVVKFTIQDGQVVASGPSNVLIRSAGKVDLTQSNGSNR